MVHHQIGGRDIPNMLYSRRCKRGIFSTFSPRHLHVLNRAVFLSSRKCKNVKRVSSLQLVDPNFNFVAAMTKSLCHQAIEAGEITFSERTNQSLFNLTSPPDQWTHFSVAEAMYDWLSSSCFLPQALVLKVWNTIDKGSLQVAWHTVENNSEIWVSAIHHQQTSICSFHSFALSLFFIFLPDFLRLIAHLGSLHSLRATKDLRMYFLTFCLRSPFSGSFSVECSSRSLGRRSHSLHLPPVCHIPSLLICLANLLWQQKCNGVAERVNNTAERKSLRNAQCSCAWIRAATKHIAVVFFFLLVKCRSRGGLSGIYFDSGTPIFFQWWKADTFSWL